MPVLDVFLSGKVVEGSLLHISFLSYYRETHLQDKGFDFLCQFLEESYNIWVFPLPHVEGHYVVLLLIGGVYEE
jgi:hypothetical protein